MNLWTVSVSVVLIYNSFCIELDVKVVKEDKEKVEKVIEKVVDNFEKNDKAAKEPQNEIR